MRIASLSDFLLQRIERSEANGQRKAVNRQIYQVIREAILDQSLPAGLQLPSSRYLAIELKVSRNTVTYAYDQLLAEGYLESRAGAGSAAPALRRSTTPNNAPTSDYRCAASSWSAWRGSARRNGAPSCRAFRT